MISPKLLSDGEEVVISARTHPKALLVPVLLGLVCLAIGVFVSHRWLSGTTALVWWVVIAVAILGFTGWPFLEWRFATNTLTNRRLITRRGVLSRSGHDIPLVRISDVAYEMGIVDRMLGCGTLLVSDASTFGTVRLHDIPHIEDMQRTINDLLQQVHHPGNDDGA